MQSPSKKKFLTSPDDYFINWQKKRKKEQNIVSYSTENRTLPSWDNEKNKYFFQVSRYSLHTTRGSFLTLGGPSSDGTFSWGIGLDWGWVCGSLRAGVDDDKNDGDDEEDAGRWCWWGSWLLCGWWFSKLGVSGSVKECDRDMTGGVDEFGEVTLMLLLRAATCERTFLDNKTEHNRGT